MTLSQLSTRLFEEKKKTKKQKEREREKGGVFLKELAKKRETDPLDQCLTKSEG